MSASPLPAQSATKDQLRALHAAGRARGLRHEDLRAAAGVTSLTLLSSAQASALLDQLNADRPAVARASGPTARPAAGVIRPGTDRQRHKIFYLLADLGWSADYARDWLRTHHGVADLNTHAFTTSSASAVITQLEQILKHKGAPRVRPDGRNA